MKLIKRTLSKYIKEKFIFDEVFRNSIPKDVNVFKDNYIGNAVFLRSYSNRGETWGDVVLRVIEGVISIQKTHSIVNNLYWDQDYWNEYGQEMAMTMYDFKWSPAGRHLKNMGTDKIDRYGGLSLNNCTAISTDGLLSEKAVIMFRFLRDQAGVGFDTEWNGELYQITDGIMEYDKIDDPAQVINGVLSAYETGSVLPIYVNLNSRLQVLNDRIVKYCREYLINRDKTLLVVSIMNSIGVYVGGTYSRRSAQIAMGSPYDETFLNLKDYSIYDRSDIGWASNNSVVFMNKDDFQMIPDIAKRIEENGEPGIINGLNIMKFGRLGKETEVIHMPDGRNITLDMSEVSYRVNPCGEQTLEAGEACNLSTSVPMACDSIDEWYKVLEYCTVFSSIVSLLMTEYPETNKLIAKNRRLGVSISGVAEMFDTYNSSEVISFLKHGYNTVRITNIDMAQMNGVPISKKVTTIKPDGNLSLLLNCTPGIHYPPFDSFAIRRMQVRKNDPLTRQLKKMNIPYEELENDDSQYVFEFPYCNNKNIRSVNDVSIWEQLRHNEILQRFWSDNNVSFTGRFNNKDKYAMIDGKNTLIRAKDNLENVISMSVPFIKSVSFLPQDDEELKKKYSQLPYEEIDEVEYNKRLQDIRKIVDV